MNTLDIANGLHTSAISSHQHSFQRQPLASTIGNEIWADACLYLTRKDLCQLQLINRRLTTLLNSEASQSICKQLYWLDRLDLEGNNIEITNIVKPLGTLASRLSIPNDGEWFPLDRDKRLSTPANYIRVKDIVVYGITPVGMEFLQANAPLLSAVTTTSFSTLRYTDWQLHEWQRLFELFKDSRILTISATTKSFEVDNAIVNGVLRYAIDWLETGELEHGRSQLEEGQTVEELPPWCYAPFHGLEFTYEQCNGIILTLLDLMKERFNTSTQRPPYITGVHISTRDYSDTSTRLVASDIVSFLLNHSEMKHPPKFHH